MPSADPVPKNPRHVDPSAPSGPGYLGDLLRVGGDAGLDAMGVAPAMVLGRALAQIRDRVDRDLVNGMRFTFHRPERSTNVPALVEGARSVIVGARSYDLPAPAPVGADPRRPRAEVARYAWVDHYADLKESLTAVASRLRRDGHRAVVFADDNSIVDREVAWLAGLGWFGKNANILLPGRGSFFVLGCVVTTAELPVADPVEDGCGACSRCIPACPTGAIVGHGVIDANRCLSWLLQKPGVFDRALRPAVGSRIYGCDDCQTACPFTARASQRRGAGTTGARGPVVAGHDVLELLAMDDAGLDALSERWYVHQRDMTWVRRNLLVILGNIGRPDHAQTVEAIARHARHDNPVLRAHAVWAAARLGLSDVVATVENDPSLIEDLVADELAHLPALRDDL